MKSLSDNFSYEGKQLFKKGGEIIEVIEHIANLIPEDNEALQSIKEIMLHDAYQLQVKVSGAEAIDLYDLKMEAASFIRKAAKDLIVQKHALEMFDFEDSGYFDIVRELIEEYRLLFIQWVAKFDKWDYIIDRWGLFNPPGVSPHDKDPDDDIPF
ncbi:hypothetical protein [Plebeiibacterium sediminum]|uniref:Uncharacterized protein n=1 Tax=Plebeiibacterium sediminum TaxID=2992112 RepID=A0AAE3M432_9BACT|nr:hypothetical protein [Plebeiobacterium sediminum]MCW3786432.1 hypothetical protein [Plebeiobacterium sediminum]